ncbi:hypothetical protein VTO42DRAFT_4069 [Malbranchea cinnamomea]
MSDARTAQRPRLRCARACDACKRRKEKCNGQQPCTLCLRRGKEAQCRFSNLPARAFRGAAGTARMTTTTTETATATQSASSAASSSAPVPKLSFRLSEDMPDTGKSDVAIAQLLNSVEDDRSSSLDGASRPGSDGSAPVPKVARLLRAGQGSFMYVGDSANVSLLQSVRRIVSFAVGPCDLTTDRLRHTFLEVVPDPAAASADGLDLKPSYEEGEKLVRQYVLATSGLVDLIDVEDFLTSLAAWVDDPSGDKDVASAMFYLVLAIGAQASASESTQARAERYFTRGRQLAFSAFSEVPSLLTVKTYILIATFLLGACRRNSAFMNLGTALRAAYALGIHRSSANILFCDKERRDRNRAWKSLRVMDIFLSASLGRPPATSNFEYEPSGDESPAAELCRAAPEDKFRVAVVLLCGIFERILTDVYKKQVVSAQVAERISVLFRAWAGNLPPSLDLSSFSEQPSDTTELKEFLAASHIIGGYYWSIILLTRPFLIFQVSQHVRRKRSGHGGGHDDNTRIPENSRISIFADACVDSALRGLDLVYSLRHFSSLPRRLPFIVNYIFNSALVLGAAFFGDYDTVLPLEDGMDKAEEFLAIFLPHDPHACRYAQILKYLRSAVAEYVSRRNRQSMEKRREKVNRLFGSIGQKPENSTATRPPQPPFPPPPPPPPSFRATPSASVTNTNFAHNQFHININSTTANPPSTPSINDTNPLPSPVSAPGAPSSHDDGGGGSTWDGPMPSVTQPDDSHDCLRMSSATEEISTLTTSGIPINGSGIFMEEILIPARFEDEHHLLRERLAVDGGGGRTEGNHTHTSNFTPVDGGHGDSSVADGGLLDAASQMGDACTPPALDTMLVGDGLLQMGSYPLHIGDLGMFIPRKNNE